MTLLTILNIQRAMEPLFGMLFYVADKAQGHPTRTSSKPLKHSVVKFSI